MTDRLFDRERLDEIGRVMHESWCARKRAQGFHGPSETCKARDCTVYPIRPAEVLPCDMFDADLIPWEQLPEKQKDINRHAADALIERGLLIPRAEHEAAIAAVVEKVAQAVRYRPCVAPTCQVQCLNHTMIALAAFIRSLASQSAQDALREAKAEAVSNALDRLSQILEVRISELCQHRGLECQARVLELRAVQKTTDKVKTEMR